MNNITIGLLIALVLIAIVGNILLLKSSAKLGLKNKDGSDAKASDDSSKRHDNNANWDDED